MKIRSPEALPRSATLLVAGIAAALFTLETMVVGVTDGAPRTVASLLVVATGTGIAALAAYLVVRARAAHRRLESRVEATEATRRHHAHTLAALARRLRSPVTRLHDLADCLLGASPGEVQDLAATAYVTSIDARRFLDDLVAMARLASGDAALCPRPVPLSLVLADACRSLRPHGVEVRLPSTDLWVLADPGALEQAVRDLVAEAATRRGRDIRVEAATRNGSVLLTVADDGDPAVASAPGDEGVGGLGVLVARALVERMGGSLGYLRMMGWTRFTVVLPAVEVERRRAARHGAAIG